MSRTPTVTGASSSPIRAPDRTGRRIRAPGLAHLTVSTPLEETVKPLTMLFAAAVLAATSAQPCFGAEAIRETRAVSGFNKIEIEGQANVILRQGTAEGLTLDASAQ